MTEVTKDQEENEMPEAASLFVYLAAGAALVIILTIVLCVWRSWGSTIAVSLTATNVGILIAAVVLKTKFSERNAQVLTAVGILLTAFGYFYSLHGAFYPVSEVSFETSQMFTVKTDAASCNFAPASSKLTCPIAIDPK